MLLHFGVNDMKNLLENSSKDKLLLQPDLFVNNFSKMELLPCFDVHEFNIGIIMDTNALDIEMLTSKKMKYAFTMEILELS